ncbi:MAG: SDR family oxidoreductase [Deltaproteobacteria bacterium]|nr:SDR family oxidoreductase [Deltaproteobacteria bacterium]
MTGAGKRLGRAIALGLAEAGCDVAVHSFRSKEDAEETATRVRALGRRAVVVAADQTSGDEVQRAVDHAVRGLGRVDHLVVSAAAFERAPFSEMTRDKWDRMIAANLTGPFEWVRAALPHLQQSDAASIIVMLDVAAFHAWRGFAHYCAAKAGLEMLVRVLALELAPTIRVNGIAPGTVLPPEDLAQTEAESIRRQIPLERFGSPDDVTRAALYLANAPFVTGTTLFVDGGRSAVARL